MNIIQPGTLEEFYTDMMALAVWWSFNYSPFNSQINLTIEVVDLA